MARASDDTHHDEVAISHRIGQRERRWAKSKASGAVNQSDGGPSQRMCDGGRAVPEHLVPFRRLRVHHTRTAHFQATLMGWTRRRLAGLAGWVPDIKRRRHGQLVRPSRDI